MKAFRGLFVVGFALALTACGGGAKLGGGKDGAAQALFQASRPASSSKGAASKLYSSGITAGEVSVNGQKSGTAKLSFDITDFGQNTTSGSLKFTITYDNFSDDGKNYYSGSMTVTEDFNIQVAGSAVSGGVALTMKGKINISGDISDFVDANITETVDFSSLSNQTGTVNVVLDGTIATSTESYAYSKETINFTAGTELPKAAPKA